MIVEYYTKDGVSEVHRRHPHSMGMKEEQCRLDHPVEEPTDPIRVNYLKYI